MLPGKKRQLVTAYHQTLRGEVGKTVLDDLVAHFDLPMLRKNPALETNKVLYQGGQRSVIVYILKMLSTNPYEEERNKQAINLSPDELD